MESSSSPTLIEGKRRALKEAISRDPAAADLRFSLFVSAARSFRYDSCLQPFPPDFIVKGEKNIDQLCRVIETIPPISELANDLTGGLGADDERAVSLLHWIFCGQPLYPALRTVPRSSHDEVLAKCPCHAKYQQPSHIFEVVHRDDQSAERLFRENASHFRTRHAYHGSRLFNFHSILQYGLQQHLNKVSMFGQGIYLSAELHVSQMFASTGSAWNRSTLGTHLSCIALCEYVDNPNYVVSQEGTPSPEGSNDSSFPERYVLVKNNEMVQVRYLLLYGTTKEAKASLPQQPVTTALATSNTTDPAVHPAAAAYLRARPPSRFVQWFADNKGFALIGGYVGLLLIVGFVNSRNAHYVKELFLQQLNHVCNAVLGLRPNEGDQ
ncbi:protein mono-ADP-ribosyltransferase PARP16-like [Anopheles darlingi]|uniref:protein mono-ADP-ribosyltransferase PARP16-like n=1 Tax=Anopheles darlingi TaxID=43151 RepID=UPI00210006A2|nr:protein mono-ADP-ribosyltransferase PARP16-like [Anopheles darlingi]